MPKFVQEKFQVNLPLDPPEDHQWMLDARGARTKKGMPGREGRPGGDPSSRHMNNAVLYNTLPPGMDIDDQEFCDSRELNFSIAGNFARGHNAGDRTQDLNATSLRKGFDRKVCCPTDDMYTREHNDAFYDSPEVDGQEGFVERNNYLDRL